MLKENDLEKIERYINGQSDNKEKAWVESLFLNGEDNFALKQSLERDWNQTLKNSSSAGVELNHLLDRIHHKIRKNESLKRQKPVQKLIRLYIRVAAILLIPLMVAGGLYYRHQGNRNKILADLVNSTIFAPMGSRVTFNLPDGTKGMLNSGSQLSYSLPFDKNRTVTLNGEAWFEVSHDEEHPFEINTGTSKVKVLGTSFDLSAYPEENYVEVVLQEGKVEFQDNTSDEKVTILPSERLVFKNGTISKSLTDPEKYNAWTEGMLVFRGDPMSEVARRIERWYNVEVVLSDQKLENYSFRATFLDDTLEEVLHCLSLTSPISYNISQREQLPDGTYKKEIVTIYLKK